MICCFVGRRTSTQDGDGLNNTHTVKTELPSNFAAGRLPTCICLPRECGSRVSEQHPYGPIPESILQTVNSIAAEAPARGRGTRHRNRPVKQPNQCFLSFSTDLQTHTSAYTQLIPCPMPYFRKKKNIGENDDLQSTIHWHQQKQKATIPKTTFLLLKS